MYFQSFDILHLVILFIFLSISSWVIFFRYKKFFTINEKTLNYTRNRKSIIIRISSLILSLLFISITILEPSGLTRDFWGQKTGIDCIWLLDVSKSMDVVDVTENNRTISRLTKAKSVIENYIIAHPENRYALVIFAGSSRLVSPLTSEHSSLLTFLSSIDSKSLSDGGTDFPDALKLAVDRFDSKEKKPHAIVLLSDGWDSEDTPDVASIRNIFSGKNANLTTVGIGQTKPSPIPLWQNPFRETSYKIFNGETVLSGLNKDSLKRLADIWKWSFIEGNSPENKIEKALNSISKQTFIESTENSSDMTTRIFVMASFFFFLIFLLFPSSFLKKWNVL